MMQFTFLLDLSSLWGICEVKLDFVTSSNVILRGVTISTRRVSVVDTGLALDSTCKSISNASSGRQQLNGRSKLVSGTGTEGCTTEGAGNGASISSGDWTKSSFLRCEWINEKFFAKLESRSPCDLEGCTTSWGTWGQNHLQLLALVPSLQLLAGETTYFAGESTRGSVRQA